MAALAADCGVDLVVPVPVPVDDPRAHVLLVELGPNVHPSILDDSVVRGELAVNPVIEERVVDDDVGIAPEVHGRGRLSLEGAGEQEHETEDRHDRLPFFDS